MSEQLANWPTYDGLEDEPQTLAAWQDPDTGKLLVIERGTGSWRDEIAGFTHFVVLRSAPFWEDDHVLNFVARCQSRSEAHEEAMKYMARNRL